MAQIKNGLLSGKIGNMVASSYKGKAYLKTAPQRKAPLTEGELKNHYIFKMVYAWAKPLHAVFRVGFKAFNERIQGVHAGISMIHKEALHRDGYDSYITPELVKISFGTLGLPAAIQVELEQSNLQFTWDTHIDEQKDPRDRVLLLAYKPESFEAFYNLSGPKRYEGTASLSLAGASPGNYHVYLAFVAANGKRQSMSRHLGVYNV